MKYLLSIIFACVLLSGTAQNAVDSVGAVTPTPNDSIPFEFRKQAYIYNMAKKYNDPEVARMAIYNLIASSQNALHLMDTLALMYLEREKYASAALISQDIASINPSDMFATEIAAVAFESLGVRNKAVNFYEKLYLENNDLSTLYKVAFLQFQLKRYGESLTNADIIIESPESKEIKLLFSNRERTKNQEIPMEVAAIRLKGMIEEDRGNKSLAADFYKKGLEISPDFEILQDQLKAVSE